MIVKSPALPLTSCVTLGKSLKLSVSQYPHLQTRNGETHPRGLFR